MDIPRSGELLGDRYVAGEPIGQGSSGIVFRARDRWTSRQVAIKLLKGPDAVELARREYELAGDAAHCCLARALDVGRLNGSAFVVFELAEGQHFDRALRGAEPAALIEALDDLLGAVGYLHARGVIHGDLKPENVRVAWSDGRPVVRLLDLGLARPPGQIGGGNAAYGAPEAMGGTATACSDLFSVGAMAFEVLAGGVLPFGDPSSPEYLSRLMQEEPVPLPEQVPAGLKELVGRLLSKQPATRYRSTAEARAALRSAARHPPPVKETPSPPRLVERDEALRRIYQALASQAEADLSAIVIAGAPRSGRSTLLQRAVIEGQLLGMRAIGVTARDGLKPLLGQLLEQAETLGAEREARAADEEVNRSGRSPEARFAPLFAVLRALEAVGTRGGGVLVAIDDLDRSDNTTAEAVRFLTASAESSRIVWLLVAGPDAPAGSVRCSPLSAQGVEAVVSAMLPGLPATGELAQVAYQGTGGIAGEVVDGVMRLVNERAIRFADGRWGLRAEGIARDAFGALSVDRIAELLNSLSAEVRGDLAAAALDGGCFEAACERLELGRERSERARNAGIGIRALRNDGGRLAVASDGVRELLVSGLPQGEERRIRRALVQSLARCTAAPEIARRAEHLQALGLDDEAVQESLRAADAAFANADLQATCKSLEDACNWGGSAIGRRVALRRAEALATAGSVEQALVVLDEALDCGCEKIAVQRTRGRILARAGRYDAAIEVLREAAVGNDEGDAADDRFWLGWSLMMRGRYREAEALASTGAASSRDRARLGRLRGTVAWHGGSPDHACAILQEALADATESGDALVVIEVEQSLGTAERLRGNLDAAAAHYEEAIRLARAAGFAPLLAKCLNNLAIVHYQAGKWKHAHRAWETMNELAIRLDAKEEVLLAHNNLALLFKDRGELERAERDLDRAVDIARDCGLKRYQAMALGNRAEVLTIAGQHERAGRDLGASVQLATEIGSRNELLECGRRRAALSLAAGRPEEALAEARAAAEAAEERGDTVERGNALLVACAAARALGQLEDANKDLQAVVALFENAGTDLDRARANLEKAHLAAAYGQESDAREAAREAASVFSAIGAERELNAARQLQDGGQSAGRAQAMLDLLRVAANARDVDALLGQTVERLLSITGSERGCVVLLEGREGPRLAARKSLPGVDDQLPVLSRGIADRVVASGRPLVLVNVGEEMALASRESVAALGVKAALCAPLKRGEQALGLLYVDSRKGPELVRFGTWILDAATAIIVPALERLIEAERERERVLLLRNAATDTLEAVCAVDASLDLLSEESDEGQRQRLIAAARGRTEELTRRSEGLLELLQSEDGSLDGEPESIAVKALLGCTLDVFASSGSPVSVDIREDAPQQVRGHLEPLAAALARIVDMAQGRAQGDAPVRVVAEGVTLDNDPHGRTAWRPGQSAGRRFLRIEIVAEKAKGAPGGEDDPLSPDNLSMKAVARVIRRSGGRLQADAENGRFVLEFETAGPEAI